MSEDASTQYESLKSKFEGFARDVRMKDIISEVDDISQSARTLPEQIQRLRDRGYAFRAYLEKKAEIIQQRWDDIKQQVQRAIDQESEHLREDFDDVEKKLEAAERVADNNEKLAARLEMLAPAMERIETQIEAAKERVQEVYGTLHTDIMNMQSQLREIEWFCEQKEEASFDFLAGESLFLAAKAEWVQTGKGKKDPDGIMYLTDQRMMFEQKETTGKKLGMFGGKKEQDLEWEVPLNMVENVEWENKGMFGGKDMLTFTMASGAPHAKITVEVKGGVDNKFWAKQVERMIAGETDDERAIEPDPEYVEAVKNAPTACHVCGGTLPKVVANQNQIDCLYCGAVIRL